MVRQLEIFKIDRGVAQFNSSDYYAVLGAPVTSDTTQIRKRYLSIAKNLHPDIYGRTPEEKAIATKYFSKLVSPAYSVLVQERERVEYTAILKLLAKRLMKKPQKILPNSELARRLIHSPSELEYERAVAAIANLQYSSLDGILEHTNQLSELNLIYVLAREGYQNFGLPPTFSSPSSKSASHTDRPSVSVPSQSVSQPEIVNSNSVNPKVVSQNHIRQAESFISKQQWTFALKELRAALQLDNTNSKIHALLGFLYMNQKQSGMAKVSFQQALKLNPKEPLALQYISKVSEQRSQQQKDGKKGGFFGWLG